MLRLVFFLVVLFITAVFGWWTFFPLSLLYIYLAKVPYEVIVVGGIMDTVYYLGEGLVLNNLFGLFAFFAIVAAIFLEDRLEWEAIL